jgi:hypothetical protein
MASPRPREQLDTPGTMSTAEVDENPYLALRAAKIARNHDKLNELGLLKPTPKPPTTRSKKTSLSTRRAESLQPTRRSTRNTDRPSTLESLSNDVIIPTRKRQRRSDNQKETATNAKKTYVFKDNSVRRIEISASDTVDKFLGHTMEKTGKAFVIETTLGGMDASFNKYSGVQEWGNDAIYLWVNVGKKDDDVLNDFLDDGRQITWYGGSRMHDETPAILKLLGIGKSKSLKPENGIVLWCRHYNADAKTHHPYTCLGRLSYESHVPGSQPLQFVWNLLDYERLVQHKDANVRKRFQEILP